MLNANDMKASYGVDITACDPVLSNTDLPLRKMYFPLGFPLEIISNSAAVMAAAEQSWGLFERGFDCPWLQLRIGVTRDDNGARVPAAPVCRLQWNLLSNIADGHNFVVSDLREGRSFGWITESTAESSLYLRYHMLEAAALSMVAFLRAAPVHAACVSLLNRGILLCGDSGAGKSSLAFACARAGWTFTSDDASYIPLDRSDRLVVGNSHQIRFRSSGTQLFPELVGRPVTPRAAGKPSIEIPTSELPGLLTADSSVIEHIVFLNRQDVDSPQLVTLPRESLLLWFEGALIKAAESYAPQRNALRRLLAAETFELRYKGLDGAVERLQQLVLTGR